MPQTVEELLTHFDSGMRRKHALGIIRYVKATADHIRVRTGDDREALFSGTLLTAAIATMFRHKYKEEVWSPDGGILHFDTSANPAAIAVGWREIDHYGSAALISDDGHDAPVADIKGEFNLEKPGTIATRINWTYMESLQAGMDGAINLGKEKGEAAREAWDRGIAAYVRNGLSAMGWAGIYSLPNSIVVAGTATWTDPNTTAQTVLNDFNRAALSIADYTDETGKYDTAVVPSNVWGALRVRFHGDNADKTAIDSLQKAFPDVKKWVMDPDLRYGNDAGTGPAILLLNTSKEAIRALLPMTFTPRPAQVTDLETTTLFISRYAGLAVHTPREMVKLQGIG